MRLCTARRLGGGEEPGLDDFEKRLRRHLDPIKTPYLDNPRTHGGSDLIDLLGERFAVITQALRGLSVQICDQLPKLARSQVFFQFFRNRRSRRLERNAPDLFLNVFATVLARIPRQLVLGFRFHNIHFSALHQECGSVSRMLTSKVPATFITNVFRCFHFSVLTVHTRLNKGQNGHQRLFILVYTSDGITSMP